MTDEPKKDPSRAEVGPLADKQDSYDVVDKLPKGEVPGEIGTPTGAPDVGEHSSSEETEKTASHDSEQEEGGDLLEDADQEAPVAGPGVDEDFEADLDKEARRVSEPEPATPPEGFRPLRPTPDLGKRKDNGPSDIETDLDVHGAEEGIEDRRDDIKRRIEGLKAEQSEPSHQEVVEQEVKERKEDHEEFMSEPTDVKVDRGAYDDAYSRASSYPIDSYTGAMPKSGESDLVSSLQNDHINPIRLMQVAGQLWDDDWIDWEPETILDEVERIGGFELPDENKDKIMALKVLLSNDLFWNQARVFENVVVAFNHRIVDWGHLQNPPTHDIVAAKELVDRHLRAEEFSSEVKHYTAATALRDGYVMVPPSLRFARQPFTEKLIETMGDEALARQERLNEALQSEDVSGLSEEDMIQYIRLIRCSQHKQAVLDEVH